MVDGHLDPQATGTPGPNRPKVIRVQNDVENLCVTDRATSFELLFSCHYIFFLFYQNYICSVIVLFRLRSVHLVVFSFPTTWELQWQIKNNTYSKY